MLDPKDLYTVAGDATDLRGAAMLQVLDGFIDAGSARRLARDHLVRHLDNEVVVTFDADQLVDHRSRRPPMLFVEDHWEHYEAPALVIRRLRDAAGKTFLLLDGPEPDYQWERFVAAVSGLVDQWGVAMTIGVNAIPMAVPHTRPTGITAHASRPALVAGHRQWFTTVQVPGSAGHLLEYRLGQSGHDAVGLAVHVPHYLAQGEYPAAAGALLADVARIGQLSLPTDDLDSAAQRNRVEIDEQVAKATDVAAVVHALEAQYDTFVATQTRPITDEAIPSADELGAELERFLAEHRRGESGLG